MNKLKELGTFEKVIGLITLVVTICACIGTFLAVPQIQTLISTSAEPLPTQIPQTFTGSPDCSGYGSVLVQRKLE